MIISEIDARRTAVTQRIIDVGALAVLRMRQGEEVLPVAEALLKGGAVALEVTMTVPGALEVIGRLSSALGDDAIIGVGSVLDWATAQRAIDAGATYVLSPVLKREVIEAAHEAGCPVMPGAFTPTEVQTAHEWGADIVKVFPADVVGMPFFKAVLAPLPHLKIMPTGGVTLTNAGDWLRAGAVAVGVGSALLDRRAIREQDYAQLTRNAEVLMASIREARHAMASTTTSAPHLAGDRSD